MSISLSSRPLSWASGESGSRGKSISRRSALTSQPRRAGTQCFVQGLAEPTMGMVHSTTPVTPRGPWTSLDRVRASGAGTRARLKREEVDDRRATFVSHPFRAPSEALILEAVRLSVRQGGGTHGGLYVGSGRCKAVAIVLDSPYRLARTEASSHWRPFNFRRPTQRRVSRLTV
jgi:hypothetical protein